MDGILNWGTNMILFLQSLGSWLIAPMNFFSFFGNELFFLFVAPAIFWCVDATLGMRAGLGLLTSLSINAIFKLAFHAPRPYWYDLRVRPYSSETSFGIPSGHAQNSVVLWSLLANWVNRPLAWVVAVAMILLVSLSRMVLGMHFPSDILAGWVIGILLVWAILRFEKPVLGWLRGRQIADQVVVAFAASLALILTGALTRLALGAWTVPTGWVELAARAPGGAPITPLSLTGLVTSAASFFGLALGGILLYQRGWFDASGSFWLRLARFLVGLGGVFIIWYGLDKLFPDGDTVIPLFLRYLRYAAVGLWMSYLAPLVFFRLKLAHPKYQ
jgi:membrane-associated phospholipid phosphatase